jgi:hypothetical protein
MVEKAHWLCAKQRKPQSTGLKTIPSAHKEYVRTETLLYKAYHGLIPVAYAAGFFSVGLDMQLNCCI